MVREHLRRLEYASLGMGRMARVCGSDNNLERSSLSSFMGLSVNRMLQVRLREREAPTPPRSRLVEKGAGDEQEDVVD